MFVYVASSLLLISEQYVISVSICSLDKCYLGELALFQYSLSLLGTGSFGELMLLRSVLFHGQRVGLT